MVLHGLATAGVPVILLKGTPLAYSLYPMPSARPRVDTDLLVPRHQVDRLRETMAGMGYEAPLFCDGELLFCQFPLQRTDAFGVVHRFDCHWRISTQSVFADVLTFDEVAPRSIPVPALGEHARTLAPVDALLLACVHPVMHHRNAESLLWLFDVHLLAASLSNEEFAALHGKRHCEEGRSDLRGAAQGGSFEVRQSDPRCGHSRAHGRSRRRAFGGLSRAGARVG